MSDFENSQLPERRTGLTEEKVLLMIANAMTANTAAMEERIIKAINDNIDEKVTALSKRVDDMHDVFEDHVQEAFPGGPLVAHKLDHEGRMRWAETKQKLGVDLIRYSMLGAVGFVFILLGLGALEYIKRAIQS
jgi:hypothetical protein